MDTQRHSNLHEFSLLLNSATSYAKVAKALSGAEAPEGWSAAAKELSEVYASRNGELIELPPIEVSMGSVFNKPEYKGHLLALPAKYFAELAKAVGEISDADVDRAAEIVAKQLVVPFEKDGVSHLAFPHQGEGVKVKKKKSGALEVFDWKSDWEERAKTALPKDKGFANRHARYQKTDVLEKLSPNERLALASLAKYWERSAAGMEVATKGESAIRGVHAGGKLSGSASSEESLASLEKDESVRKSERSYANESEASVIGLEHREAFDPTQRRLGWGAVAILLGDKLSDAEAASAHSSPCMRTEMALMLEIPGDVGRGQDGTPVAGQRVPFPGKTRAMRPATCVFQLATSLVAAGKIKHMFGRFGVEKTVSLAMSFDARRPEDISTMEADEKKAAALLGAVNLKSGKLMAKAYELAKEAEKKWLSDQGLGPAIEDAKLLGKGRYSAKSLNWVLENPGVGESLKKAAENPELGFAAKSARFLGVRAQGEEQTIERAKAGWAAMGLGAEGYAGVSASARCSDYVSNLWKAKQEEKKSDRAAYRQDKIELTCRSFQAAFASGTSEKEAFEFVSWCMVAGENCFIRDPASCGEAGRPWDRLSARLPERMVGLWKDAKKTSDAAKARSDAMPGVMRAAFRAFAWAEDMPERCKDAKHCEEREKLALKWLVMAAAGADKSPEIEWGNGVEGASLRDLAHRANGRLGAAMKQAAKDGVHGAFAARVAIGLGIEDASDANDLVSKTKERLKEEFDMGDSGWKALGKAPKSMREHLAKQLEQRAVEVLESRAKFKSLEGALARKSQDAAGLGLALLSGAGHFGIPLEDADLVEGMGRVHSTGLKSELLRHGVRPIKVSSLESAQFAEREALAKSERLPRIAKSLGERFGKMCSDLEKQGQEPESTRGKAKRQLEAEVALVDDWLKATEDGVWQTLPAKAVFGDLMRRQVTWHEDMAARVAAGQTKGPAKSWGSPLTRHVDGEWSAVLLGTADELTEEGREMHHCVSSYSGYCKGGTSRIYSVRLSGERVSTLEVKLSAGGVYKAYDHQHPVESEVWLKSQNSGKCNGAIKDPSALAFCEEVVAKINVAHVAWTKDLAHKRSLIAQQAAETRKKGNVKMG